MPNRATLAAERHLRLVRVDRDAIADAVRELDRKLDAPFTPTRECPSPNMFTRGVYVLPYFDTIGNPLVAAVRSDGRLSAWLPWLPGQTWESIADELWFILDAIDPVVEAVD